MKKYILKNKTNQKSIRFPTELLELIAKIAKIENRKSTNLINKIIIDHFNDDKNKYYSNKKIIDLINKWKASYVTRG